MDVSFDSIKRRAKYVPRVARSLGRRKVFCVGRNKTGTTSLAVALKDLGLVVAPQAPFECLIKDWKRRDFRRLRWYCRFFQAFQDVPFSMPFTFQAMDMAFPGSKFILTERDSPEQWYHSLTKFHAKLFGTNGIPTRHDLEKAQYRYPGWAWEGNRALYDTPEDDPYRQDVLIKHYSAHNHAVKEYFRHRPDDLLVLNVAADGAMEALCRFLGIPFSGQSFPWMNRTADRPVSQPADNSDS